MRVKALRFHHFLAMNSITAFTGHLLLVLIRTQVAPTGRRKQKNGAIGHNPVNIEEDQLDLPRTFFGHGPIVLGQTLFR